MDILFPEFSIQRVSKNLERNSIIPFSSNSRPVKINSAISTETNQSKVVSSDFHEGITAHSTQFGLLMENISAIEDILGDKGLVSLQKDILSQIKQLGALNLFHDFLNKNLELSSWTPNPLQKQRKEKIIRTGKIEERRLKRAKALEKRANEITDLKLPRKIKKVKKYDKKTISFGWRCRKNLDGRSESELAEGIKVAAELERLREKIETLTGRPVRIADWARAAGIDARALTQRLIFGSYCKNELVKSARPLVLYFVKKFRGMGVASEDLFQAGNLGVLRGAERFDIKRGYKFSTYVRFWIHKAIFELIAENSRIFRMSVRAESLVQKIEKAKRELRFRFGRNPRDEELAKFTDLSLDKIRLARRCSRSVLSFNQYIMPDSNVTLEDVIPDSSKEAKEYLIGDELKEGLLYVLEELSPREKEIIVLRYGLEDGTCRSLEEIGRKFHVSKEWIRKMEKGAICKLRRDDIQRYVRKLLDL
ncbi:hypothetical protein LUZ60_008496 [Juncus effusus]|nr:hypothetical protein LUZ60_008496 [Juncus effusus]